MMRYVLLGMCVGVVAIAVAETLVAGLAQKGVKIMSNALLFLLGFSSITTIYEIAKTGKKTNSQKLQRGIDVNSKKVR